MRNGRPWGAGPVAQSDTSDYGTIRSLHQPETVHRWGDFTTGIRRDNKAVKFPAWALYGRLTPNTQLPVGVTPPGKGNDSITPDAAGLATIWLRVSTGAGCLDVTSGCGLVQPIQRYVG